MSGFGLFFNDAASPVCGRFPKFCWNKEFAFLAPVFVLDGANVAVPGARIAVALQIVEGI